MRSIALAACLAVAVAVAPAAGHVDDPKAQDRMAPYVGPGFRAGAPGANPAAGSAAVFPRSSVRLHAWLPLGDFGTDATTGSDCWGYLAPSGRAYAIMTMSNAVSFVEVTDPGNPVIVATFLEPESLWRDAKTYLHYAYTVTEGGGGIRTYDLAQIDRGIVTPLGNVITGGEERTHNVAIDPDSGFLYRCGGGPNAGLRIYSLADPTTPAFVGQWPDRYVHDAQVVTYTEGPYAGKQIAFCCSGFNGGSVETGLTILDVSDKANIVVLSQTAYSNPAYSHQCWLSEDRTLLYLNDELDERNNGTPMTTRVINVSDLAAPFEAATFTNGTNSIDHNLYVHGDLLFQANYRSGLRIWDLSDDPLAPFESAFFDTFPDEDGTATNGAWSVYPYFPNGAIIVSDLERGLFVLEYEEPRLWITTVGPPPGDLIDPAGTSFMVSIDPINGGALEPGTAKLVVDGTGGSFETPLVAEGGNVYTAVLPAFPCTERVSFYVEAVATDGTVARLPRGAPAPGFTFEATAADATTVSFTDDFESDTGWIAGLPEDTATTGEWVRTEPTSSPDEDNPAGAGTFCFVTGDLSEGSFIPFVRDGFVSLVSPVFDANAGDGASVEYARWFIGAPPASDPNTFFEVSVSNDDGATWTVVSTTLGAGAVDPWQPLTFRIDEYVTPTATVRVKFVASSTTFAEAGIDDVRFFSFTCAPACPEDLDGDGSVAFADLLQVLSNWGPCPACPEDLNANGAVDFGDVLLVLSAFGACP